MKDYWKILPLGDLCEILDYKRKPVTKRDRKLGEYPYYGATGLLDYVDEFLFDEKLVLIGEDGAKWGAGESSAYIIEGKSWVNNHAHVLRPNRNMIMDEWIVYYINFSDLTEFVTGLTVPKLNQAKLREIPIPIPPLPEQQRIVRILDEAFAGIAVARANAEKNLQNAREVFENYLNEVFTKHGKGWVERKLGDVCIVERGSSPRPIKNFFTNSPDGVNWIKIGDTKEGEKYIYSTGQKITPEGAKQSRFVKENDFLLTNSMSFGRPYIMKTTGYIHDGWFVLRLNQSINLDYFYYLLSSEFVRSQFNRLASGSIVLNISSDLVKQAKLPIPAEDEQIAIVRKADSLFLETNRLEKIFSQKLDTLDELKQSLLHHAFTCQL